MTWRENQKTLLSLPLHFRFYNQRFLCDYEMAWLVLYITNQKSKINTYIELTYNIVYISCKICWKKERTNIRVSEFLLKKALALFINFDCLWRWYIHSNCGAISLIQSLVDFPLMYNNWQNTNNILLNTLNKLHDKSEFKSELSNMKIESTLLMFSNWQNTNNILLNIK